MLLVSLQKHITFIESQLKQFEQVASVGQLNLGWHAPQSMHHVAYLRLHYGTSPTMDSINQMPRCGSTL